MVKKHCKCKIRPGHILAVLFLCFIFYVGTAALPQFMTDTKALLQGQLGVNGYIGQVNAQYKGMLDTEFQHPLLQDKRTYININGLMANVLRQPMMNERLKLKNGHMYFVEPEAPKPENIRQNAENIIRFHNAHTASGGNFLFVVVPSQISKYEDILPAGYTDTTNSTTDAFLTLLEQSGVPYLDLREELRNDGMTISDSYFTTDHHWLPQTGLWAYGKMLEKLSQMGAIDPVDPFYTDPDNFTFETHEDAFLGSSGKRTGIYYAGLDDAILIRPNFDTDISIRIPQRQLDLEGRYEEVAYNTYVSYDYDNPDFFNDNVYGLYGWSDTPITHWRNENAPAKGKFLLIGESFGNIPFSLMSIYLSNCDEVDLRHFEEDFSDYYHSYSPDTVIVLVNIHGILSVFTEFEYLN